MPPAGTSNAGTSGDGLQPVSTADVVPQALEILGSLDGLGISDSLRDKVHQALAELTRATEGAAAAADVDWDSSAATDGGNAAGSGPAAAGGAGRGGKPAASVHEQRAVALQSKLDMSRSIMRKLYYKNVELEKELAIVKANKPSSSELQRLFTPGISSPGRPGTGMAASTPLAQALQERDLTIAGLQEALDASRRQVALLEVACTTPQRPGGRSGAAPNMDSIRHVVAQSSMHLQRYKQIREDYNRLLHKRAGAIQAARGAPSVAKAIVGELQQRLVKEVEEREAEAALYSARLFESERALSDWYVEKRMLEEHIARLSEELRQRDRLDGEIEGCVCSLFERLRAVEGANEHLKAKLGTLGVTAAEIEQCAASGVVAAGTSAAVAVAAHDNGRGNGGGGAAAVAGVQRGLAQVLVVDGGGGGSPSS